MPPAVQDRDARPTRNGSRFRLSPRRLRNAFSAGSSPPAMEHFWSQAVATSGDQWQTLRAKKRLNQAKNGAFSSRTPSVDRQLSRDLSFPHARRLIDQAASDAASFAARTRSRRPFRVRASSPARSSTLAVASASTVARPGGMPAQVLAAHQPPTAQTSDRESGSCVTPCSGRSIRSSLHPRSQRSPTRKRLSRLLGRLPLAFARVNGRRQREPHSAARLRLRRILVTRPFQTRIELAPESWETSAFAGGFVTRRPARQSERPNRQAPLLARTGPRCASRPARHPCPSRR